MQKARKGKCMSESRVSQVIELKLEAASPAVREALEAWLLARGIHDVVEASCDTLDVEESEVEAYIEAYESGSLNLPLLLYSYDRAWMDALKAQGRQSFGDTLSMSERMIADELWQEAWQPGFRFLETSRFWVGPHDFLTKSEGRIAIPLASGSIFGSGQHATTQAMLSLLEDYPAAGPDASFLDVGTGTGVLCFAAHHLGYKPLVGTDIEAEAIAVARQNQELNACPFELIEGSLPDVERRFSMIVCNILPPTLTGLLPELIKRLRPDGLLLLAGLNEVTETELVGSLPVQLMRAKDRKLVRGWVARSFQYRGE